MEMIHPCPKFTQLVSDGAHFEPERWDSGHLVPLLEAPCLSLSDTSLLGGEAFSFFSFMIFKWKAGNVPASC